MMPKVILLMVGLTAGLISCKAPAKKTESSMIVPIKATQPIEIDEPIGNTTSEANKPSPRQDTEKVTRFVFRDYSVLLHGFNAFNKTWGTGVFNYIGDTSQVVISDYENSGLVIKAKNDSLSVDNDPNANINSIVIEIVPNRKSKHYQVSYANRVKIEELIGKNRNYQADNQNWIALTSYKRLNDSSGRFFKIPAHWHSYNFIDEIVHKLNLKNNPDSNKGEFEGAVTYQFKGKACSINPDAFCLRIKALEKSGGSKISFITIKYQDYD